MTTSPSLPVRIDLPTQSAELGRIPEMDHRRRELIKYLGRVVGYTLTGLTVEEVMFVLHRLGANGKSTFRETVFALLGDYAVHADASLLVTNKRAGGATRDRPPAW